MKTRTLRGSVKEALDNLPGGVCFFDGRDVLRLCSRQMYRLVFALTGVELQSLEELDGALASPPAASGVVREGETYRFPDGTAWTFRKQQVTDSYGGRYTEYLAFDVSELYRRKKLLERENEEQREVMDRLMTIARNVVSITREEEILSMKMRIHNSLGLTLQSARRFFLQGCPAEDKSAFVEEQRRMAGTLLGEVGNDDEVNVYQELERIAGQLDMKLVTHGELPENEEARALLTMAVRECLTNTVRHAGGDTVYVELRTEPGTVTAFVTNNGRPPAGTVAEGGGLSSLRDKLERFGGEMRIESRPSFRLTVKLPDKEERA